MDKTQYTYLTPQLAAVAPPRQRYDDDYGVN